MLLSAQVRATGTSRSSASGFGRAGTRTAPSGPGKATLLEGSGRRCGATHPGGSRGLPKQGACRPTVLLRRALCGGFQGTRGGAVESAPRDPFLPVRVLVLSCFL